MGNLHRTQIYIEEEQIRQLKLEAVKEHLAVSELIRRAIQRLLETKTLGVNWEGDPLTNVVGRIKLAAKDASEDHDYYLYTAKKKRR